MSNERLISFKISEELYVRLNNYSEKVNISLSDCIIELLSEHIDNLETYYEMLEKDEENGRIALASNNTR